MSAFALEDGVVYHTYSAYARGLDGALGHVPVARPGAEGAQRKRHLVPAPRRVRRRVSYGCGCRRSSSMRSIRRPSRPVRVKK